MNRYRLPLAILAAALIAGCGSSPRATAPTTTTPPVPFVCHPKIPTPAGECIRQQIEAEHKTPARPRLTLTSRGPAPLCVDVSVWNGVPNFRAARVRCVIIQTNEGQTRNGLFRGQVQAAREAGIPWGTYTYLEPYVAGTPQLAVALQMAQGLGRTLGVWADAEQPGAYQNTCSYTAGARARGVHIYGVYSSPGIYTGGRCDGYAWPAEWGGGSAYPLSGYPSSAVLIRQRCGTCTLAGFHGEVDLDEALGILGLAAPPSHAQVTARERRELDAHYRLRQQLETDISREDCRTQPAVGYRRLCDRWAVHLAVEQRQIAIFHRKHVY